MRLEHENGESIINMITKLCSNDIETAVNLALIVGECQYQSDYQQGEAISDSLFTLDEVEIYDKDIHTLFMDVAKGNSMRFFQICCCIKHGMLEIDHIKRLINVHTALPDEEFHKAMLDLLGKHNAQENAKTITMEDAGLKDLRSSEQQH